MYFELFTNFISKLENSDSAGDSGDFEITGLEIAGIYHIIIFIYIHFSDVLSLFSLKLDV